MTIYLINILLLILWNACIRPSSEINGPRRKQFCVIASFQWFLLSGFRDITIGADTWYYEILFNDVAKKSWGDIWREVTSIMTHVAEGRDAGYTLLVKLFSSIFPSYRIFLIAIAALLAYTLGKFIYENSRDVLFSYLLFSCLFYSFFAITGLRQTIATCVVVFGGYGFIKRREFWKFFLITIILATIHKSCLIYLVMYFISYKKITGTYLTLITCAIGVSFAFKNPLFSFLAVIGGYDTLYNAVEGAGTWTFTLFLFAIFIVVLWAYRKLITTGDYTSQWINALCAACFFVPLTFVEPNTMRIVQYFSVFLMVLIPELFECFENGQKLTVKICAEAALILLFVLTKPAYNFMPFFK